MCRVSISLEILLTFIKNPGFSLEKLPRAPICPSLPAAIPQEYDPTPI